jgi:hypothetical protein
MIVLVKNLPDIGNTDLAQMLILRKQQRCVHLFHSPLEKTLSKLDDGPLDERIDAFDMPTKRFMRLKAMSVPVLNCNPFARANTMTHPFRNSIEYLKELLLTGAVLFNKIS